MQRFLLYVYALLAAIIVSTSFFHGEPAYGSFFGTGVPAGVIMPWWSTDTAAPNGWHLCDGSTVTWQTGPHAGSSVVLPNSIGAYFVGSDIQGGAHTANPSGFGHLTNQSTSGTITHRHSLPTVLGLPGSDSAQVELSAGQTGFTSTQPYSIGTPCIIKL